MYSAAGIDVHLYRWQWWGTRLSLWSFLVSVWLLICAAHAVLLAVAVPMPMWFAWIYWGPSAIAALLIQLGALALQVVSMTLITTISDSPAGQAGIAASLGNLIKSRDFQLVVTAYVGLIGGAVLLSHATTAWMVGAALAPLACAHVAFKRLLDSVQLARPEAQRPSITDPGNPSYVSRLLSSLRYGTYWYEPAQLVTVSTARKCVWMAEQARINLLLLSAVGVAANSAIGFPSIASSGGLIAGVHSGIFCASVIAGLLAADRYRQIGSLKEQYLERLAELEGDN